MPPAKKFSAKNKKLGRNIARLRTKASLTQEELAEMTGISTRYVQDLEAGLYTPTIFVADAVRESLQCSWEEFLKDC